MTDHDSNEERAELPPLKLPPPEDPAELTRAPRVLGVIPSGEYDTTLVTQPERSEAPKQRRKAERPELRPKLPRGAIVSLVRSGGLVFRSSEVTIYRDGRVTYDADGPGGARERAVWVLLHGEIEELRRELAAIDFEAHKFAHGRQNPDAYAYELVARVGRRVRRLELAEGSIPEELDSLIRRLASYAPPSA